MKKRFISMLTAIIMIVGLVGVMPAVNAGADNGLVWPVPGHTSLSQGYHSGYCIDISDGSIAGANIVAAKSGTVYVKYTCGSQHYGDKHKGVCDGFGTGIIIKGDDGRYYGYAHMQANSIPSNVYKGAYVSAGSKIGQVGKTGNATGNHLHFYCGTAPWTANIQISKSASEYNGGSSPSPSAPSFGTPYTTSVGNNSAYIKCSISKNGSSWGQVGAYYGTSTSNMSKAGSDSLSSGATWAGYTLSNLQAGTTYYYKFYIDANGTTYWSGVSSFKTTGGVPSPIWNSVTAYDIGNTTATIKATFSRNGASFERYRVLFGRSSNGLSEVSSGNLASGATYIRSVFPSGLLEGTTYYYQFCIIANGGIEYKSNINSFTTTGHSHSYTSSIVTPTCTSQGYTLHTCSCGDNYKDSYTRATGHKYVDTVVKSTETERGYTLHKCSVCGDSYKDNYVDSLAPENPTNPADPTDPTDPTEPTTHLGDLSGDGRITTADVGIINSFARGVTNPTPEQLALADANSDGKITTVDVGLVNAHAKGVSRLW